MKTIVVCILIVISAYGQQEQSTHSRFQPAQNEFIRLSEIPFENAVRAISTPPRDHVPIHEQQYDTPPPPRPQPVQNQPLYNPYNPAQTYQTPLFYNTQAPNAPLSYQYMAVRDYPNEVYNVLYPINSGSNQYQGGAFSQGNNYLQQPYSPYVLSAGSQIPITNNIVNTVPQNLNTVPAYNNIQSSGDSNFKPSIQISPSNIIQLSSNKQYTPNISVNRLRNAKNIVIPRIVRYVNNIPSMNGFVPSKYFPFMAPRKISVASRDFVINSKFTTDGFEYIHPM